jgi:hypothetical protein
VTHVGADAHKGSWGCVCGHRAGACGPTPAKVRSSMSDLTPRGLAVRPACELTGSELMASDLARRPVSSSDLVWFAVLLAFASAKRSCLGTSCDSTLWMGSQTHINVTFVWFVAGALAVLDRRLMVGFDHFERIDDRYGHLTGSGVGTKLVDHHIPVADHLAQRWLTDQRGG